MKELSVFILAFLVSGGVLAERVTVDAGELSRMHALWQEGVAGPPATLSPLRARGRHLVDDQGKERRVFGVGIRLTRALLDEYNGRTDELAGLIAALGSNYARIIGLDFNDPGIFEAWHRTGKLDPSTMSQLCLMIDSFERRGIYTTLSLNHYKSKLKYILDRPVLASKRKDMRYRYGQFIYPQATDRVFQWMSDVLNYTGGACTKSLAERPSVFHIDLINEESIWGAIRRKEKFSRASDGIVLDGLNRHSDKPIEDIYDRSAWTSLATLAYEYETAARMLEATRASGYTGLVSYTNKWYGHGATALNESIGDVIEIHAYFDNPRTASPPGRNTKTYKLKTRSYLDDMPWTSSSDGDDSSNAIRKVAIQLVEDKPILVTEWNHTALSNYAYEGVSLMPLFAAEQDISGLAAHTLFPRRSVAIGLDPYALVLHPAYIALSPSLAEAYLNYSIKPLPKRSVICPNMQDIEFHKVAARLGLNNKYFTDLIAYDEFASYSQRVSFKGQRPEVDACKYQATAAATHDSAAQEIPGGLLVDYGDFLLAVGEGIEVDKEFGDLQVSVEGRGAVTAISRISKVGVVNYTDYLLSAAGPGHLPNECSRNSSFISRTETIELCMDGKTDKMTMDIPAVGVSSAEKRCEVLYPAEKGAAQELASIKMSTPWLIVRCNKQQ